MKIAAITVLGDSGKEYVVTAKDLNNVTCECPSFVFRGGVCKHITFVIDTLNIAPALAR